MVAEKMGREGLAALFDAQTRSHAPMDAETFKLLAGRPKWLYEMATGESGGDTAHEPSAQRAPSGRLGHDHSGPPYGSALQHPLFSYGASQTGSNFTVDDGTNNYEPGIAVSSVGLGIQPTLVAECFVRPFPAGVNDTPYSRGYLYIGALATVNPTTINVDMWSVNRYEQRRSDSVAVTTTAWPPEIVKFSTAYWDIEPGINKLYMRFSCTSNAIAVYGVSGNQIVKRSH